MGNPNVTITKTTTKRKAYWDFENLRVNLPITEKQASIVRKNPKTVWELRVHGG